VFGTVVSELFPTSIRTTEIGIPYVSARRTHLERSGIAREDSVHQDSQVDTMEAKRIRRTHGAELKAAVVDACRQPGASIAAVALEHGINANLVHRWLRQAECAVNEAEVVPAHTELAGGFMPLSLPQSMPGDIRVEVRRGGSVITVSWPVQAASECATWLRTWLK
jgi:transposase